MATILRLDGTNWVNVPGLFWPSPGTAGRLTWICSFDDFASDNQCWGDNRNYAAYRSALDWQARAGATDTNGDPYDPSLGEEVLCEYAVPASGNGTLTIAGNSFSFTRGSAVTTLNFQMGRRNGGGTPMRGYIRDVRWYDTDQSTLIHHWPIDEGTGTVINDVVGASDGAVVGTANWEVIGTAQGFGGLLHLQGIWLAGEGTVPTFSPAWAGGARGPAVQPSGIGVF